MDEERLKSLSKIYGCVFLDKYGSYTLASQDECNWFAKMDKEQKSLLIVLGWHLDSFETGIVGKSFEHLGTDEDAENKIRQSVKEYKNALIERKKKQMETDF